MAALFQTLGQLGFGGGDTIMTSCVFAWEDRARESSTYMRRIIEKHVSAW